VEIKEESKPKVKSFDEITEEIFNITKEVYSEDRVMYEEKEKLITIHFPEVIITSSAGKKTQILKDIFIRLSFVSRSGKVKLYLVEFMRTTFTYAQIKAGYSHSHVSGGINAWSTSVCQGNTPLKKAYSLLNMEYTEKDYTDFLYLLNNWMEWESVEGGPYRKMEDVKDVFTDSTNIGILDEMTCKINLTKYLQNFDIKVSLNENSDNIKIELDEDFVTPVINSIATNKLYFDKDKNQYLLPGYNKAKIESEIESYKNNYNTSDFKFNSKTFPLVIEIPDFKLDEDNLVAHPNIKNHIINTLNNIIYAKFKLSERVSINQ
jgi:hypothetical protein